MSRCAACGVSHPRVFALPSLRLPMTAPELWEPPPPPLSVNTACSRCAYAPAVIYTPGLVPPSGAGAYVETAPGVHGWCESCWARLGAIAFRQQLAADAGAVAPNAGRERA